MKLSTQGIEAFLLIVEQGSVSAAARQLGIAKSVVSTRLSELEQSLGVRLVYRCSRVTEPTEAGRRFYDDAKGAFQRLHHAAESAAEVPHGLGGDLRILAPVTLGQRWLSTLAAEFAELHPRIDITFDLDDSIADLQRKGYDLGVQVAREPDEHLVVRSLVVSRRVLCCSPRYAEMHPLPRSLAELSKHVCLSHTASPPAEMWAFGPEGNALPAGRAFTGSRRYITNSEQSLRNAVLSDLGLSILPLFEISDELGRGRLIEVDAGVRPTDHHVYAVYPASSRGSKKVKSFVQYLQHAMATPPWEQRSQGASSCASKSGESRGSAPGGAELRYRVR